MMNKMQGRACSIKVPLNVVFHLLWAAAFGVKGPELVP
jgi:hypothetical protein